MPMYYFHLRDTDTIADVDGTELPDRDAARDHAHGVARELMYKSGGMLDESWLHWTMIVHDADGAEIFSLPFRDVDDGDNNNNDKS